MSVTYQSNVVYGVRKLRQNILDERRVRSCDCTVEGSPKFCPECGKPYMRDLELCEIEEDLEKVAGIRFYGNTYSGECKSVVVGILISSNDEDSDPSSFEMPNEEVREMVFKELQTHGFVENISELRLFNILYCSY